MDVVFLRNLCFELPVGADAWNRRGKAQPVRVSLEVGSAFAIEMAAAGDDVSKALDYGKLYKMVCGKLTSPHASFRDIHQLADAVRTCVASNVEVRMEITLPKGSLRAERGLKYVRWEEFKDAYVLPRETLTIAGIRCSCIIGVNPHERLEKQNVIIDIELGGRPETAAEAMPPPKMSLDKHRDITSAVAEV